MGNGRPDAFLRVLPAPDCPLTLDKLAQLVSWLVKDAERLNHLEEGTAQLGSRLADSYEQMHVLFGLARIVDGMEDIPAGVQRVIDTVRDGSPFRFVATLFDRSTHIRREMQDRMFLAGRSSIPEGQLRSACMTLLHDPDFRSGGTASAGAGGARMILPGDPTGLADLLQTELLAIPVRFEQQTVGILLAGEKQGVEPELSSFESLFLSACADLLSVLHENLTRFADQRALFVGTVHALSSAIDAKHRYTRGHSERVALLAREMARALGLGEATAKQYHLCGLLHDVGKIGVPEAILSKPSRLTEEEYEFIKRHPRMGYEILRDIPHLDEILPGVLHHHEAFAGRGYPDGLVGESIPLIARVLALCDTFDAMSSNRSYRASISRDAVLSEIHKCAGRQFDPDLAAVFVALDFSGFDALFACHGDSQPMAA
jgi:putative nucleotidyltransferase with HDIG domain